MTIDSKANQLMCYSFLVVFANDNTLDEKELALIEKLALEDGVIDEQERQVLQRLFDRIDGQELTDKIRAEIARFREQQHI